MFRHMSLLRSEIHYWRSGYKHFAPTEQDLISFRSYGAQIDLRSTL